VTLTDAARVQVVVFNAKHDGRYDGSGYPGHSPNEACQHFHVGTTYSCAYGNSYAFDATGHPLISMQSGMRTGYAFCPYGLNKARERHAVIGSWTTKPADLLFIRTGSSGAQPGHTEMVIFRDSGPQLKAELERILKVTLIADPEVMYSFGWDSGPSNVDHFRGQGGCHVHMWRVPKGAGNPAIMAAADASKLVAEKDTPVKRDVSRSAHRKARKHGPHGTPLAKDTESKVTVVRTRLTHRRKSVTARDRNRLRRLRAAINKALHRK